MANFPLRMPDDLHNAVAIYANVTGESMNSVMVDAITLYLNERAGTVFTAALADAQKQYAEALNRLADL